MKPFASVSGTSLSFSLISHLSQCSEKEVKHFSSNPSDYLKSLYLSLKNEARKIFDSGEKVNRNQFYCLKIALT